MLITLMMGFSSGLPLLLTLSLLQVWLRSSGVDLTTIGLFALVGLPYTLKFLWAPLLDRYSPWPLGRRRGWLLWTQSTLMVAIALLGNMDPQDNLTALALVALLVAFCSATQDTLIDAYRREHLPETELGLGASAYTYGYRVGMLLASGGGLILAGQIGFAAVYWVMALLMGAGVLTTLLAPEPAAPAVQSGGLRAMVVEPFRDFFMRADAWWVLAFILFYKLGDTLASAMTSPFYVDLGYSPAEIGAVVKLFGFSATLLGALLGGVWVLRVGIRTALWHFGFAQMLSTLGFVLLTRLGHSPGGLALVVATENLTAGMGTAAFLAFMASQTNQRYTATQYALFSSIMGIPRTLLAAPTGWMAELLGWSGFFILCTLLAVPGFWLLKQLEGWLTTPASQPVNVETSLP